MSLSLGGIGLDSPDTDKRQENSCQQLDRPIRKRGMILSHSLFHMFQVDPISVKDASWFVNTKIMQNTRGAHIFE